MNQQHLELCSSAEWAEAVERWIIPWVLDSVDLGEDVLEVGPGPGLTTDILRLRVPRLTAVEINPDLASSLKARLDGTNVDVICADATATELPSDRFTGAICLTMLHHVPTTELQDTLFSEIRRLLRPGGLVAGQDSIASDELRDLHIDDTYVPVDPAGLAARLEQAGFVDVEVDTNEYAVRFRARRPHHNQSLGGTSRHRPGQAGEQADGAVSIHVHDRRPRGLVVGPVADIVDLDVAGPERTKGLGHRPDGIRVLQPGEPRLPLRRSRHGSTNGGRGRRFSLHDVETAPGRNGSDSGKKASGWTTCD